MKKYIPEVGEKAFLAGYIHEYIVIKGFHGDKTWYENEHGSDFVRLTDNLTFVPYKTVTELAENALLSILESKRHSPSQFIELIRRHKDIVLDLLEVKVKQPSTNE
jgi:hypothetical protein